MNPAALAALNESSVARELFAQLSKLLGADPILEPGREDWDQPWGVFAPVTEHVLGAGESVPEALSDALRAVRRDETACTTVQRPAPQAPAIVLVSCGKTKLSHAAPACELYTGSLFRAARRLVERSELPWWILSAKHGLVEPSAVLEPYDQRLPAAKREREAWGQRVWSDIRRRCPQSVPVVVLAGQDYLRPLISTWARDRLIFAPLGRLELGKRLQWLGTSNRADLLLSVTLEAA